MQIDPKTFQITFDADGKPITPNFDEIQDEEEKVNAKEAYIEALNNYLTNKKTQITELETAIRALDEIESKVDDENVCQNLDQMLSQI